MQSIFFILFVILVSKIVANPRSDCRSGKFNQYLASIQTDEKHVCNGVIYNKNTVFTTALCVIDHLYRTPTGCDCRKEIKIIYNITPSNLEGLSCAREIGVQRSIVYEKFERTNRRAHFDIAVLKTNGSMVLESEFKPPNLPSTSSDRLELCEKDASLTGYWMNKTQKEPVVDTTCVNVMVSNASLCESKELGPLEGLVKPRIMCTVDINPVVNTICKAYHGAPIFCKEKTSGKTILYGLLSHRYNHSERCDMGEYLFYGRIQTYIEFLKKPE